MTRDEQTLSLTCPSCNRQVETPRRYRKCPACNKRGIDYHASPGEETGAGSYCCSRCGRTWDSNRFHDALALKLKKGGH